MSFQASDHDQTSDQDQEDLGHNGDNQCYEHLDLDSAIWVPHQEPDDDISQETLTHHYLLTAAARTPQTTSNVMLSATNTQRNAHLQHTDTNEANTHNRTAMQRTDTNERNTRHRTRTDTNEVNTHHRTAMQRTDTNGRDTHNTTSMERTDTNVLNTYRRTPTQRTDINDTPNQVGPERNLLLEKITSLKKLICVFISAMFVTIMMILSLALYGIIEVHVLKRNNIYTGPIRESNNTSGAVYVHWGRKACPSGSDIAYTGLAGGKSFGQKGSGSNYLCLPDDPEYDVYKTGVDQWRGFVYATEYETRDFPPYTDRQDHEVPCAVCRAVNRGSLMMMPAKMTCPSYWTKEYNGYLMTEYFDNPSTEYVCVDRNPDVKYGDLNNDHGAVFYPVESRCDGGNLPCPPYIHGAELTCVVCSR